MSSYNTDIINIPAGIYVHVPFCISKCHYCDFYSITDPTLIHTYVKALISEIKLTPSRSLYFDSLYFGGGTPSLLPPKLLYAIINTLFKKFQFADNIEITLEANPKTLDINLLKEFKKIGVNRIHLGIQSFCDQNLTFLGRIHSEEDAKSCIRETREAGFNNVGLDLIYGLPEQTLAKWIHDLNQAVSFSPEHLSCYMLTYEPKTVLESKRQRNEFQALSDEMMADLFDTTVNTLADKGYFQYEISNFVKTISTPNSIKDSHKYRSRHNQKYWAFAPYLGFGPSAHSYEAPKRYWNVRNLYEYLNKIDHKTLPIEDKEILTKEQQMMEVISLGLRTSKGIDVQYFENTFGFSFYNTFAPALNILAGYDLVLSSPNRLKLTSQGMRVINQVVERLVDFL